jgi:hypothetical protein
MYLLHIALWYKSNAASGLLAVHEQPSVILVINIQNLVLLDGQLSGVRSVVIVECLDD